MDSIIELLLSAGNLMLLGMAFVFIFLGVLVAVVLLMARLVPAPPVQPATRMAPSTDNPVADPGLMAAITAAVHRYRSKHI